MGAGMLAALLLSAALAAAADEPRSRAGIHPYHAAPPHPTASRQQVQGMLQAQRTGAHASSREQYLTGPVQHEIYQRYVDSFSHRIPERYAAAELSD